LNQLGTLFTGGRYAELETRTRALMALYPDSGHVWQLLGAALNAQGKDAVGAFQKAVQFFPDDANAYLNLGLALNAAGRLDDAVSSYLRAIQIRPDSADGYFRLGNILKRLGRFQEAATSYRRTLELRPNFLEAHFYLGLVLHNLGQLEEAATNYQRAIEISPEHSELHNNLGACLKEFGKIDDALASCDRALALNPQNAMAHNNLGLAFKEAGRLDEAIACYRKAVTLDQSFTQAYSNLIYLLSFQPSADEKSILAEVKQFATTYALNELMPIASPRRPGDKSGRRLRVGYVSPDFRDHCQSLFTIPLLSNHDRTQFEIYCYAQLDRPDNISERLMTFADVWRPTAGKSDEQLAQMIAGDEIDVLVDLTMHMAHGRPRLFARKPAPVQIAWLAYPGTTGVPAMDYRLTDPWLDPPELGDDRYTEQTIRLPETFWCYDPLTAALEPNALPALTTGHVTFGCLNNFCKISDDTLSRWGRVMASVPSSRLILLAAPGQHRQRVISQFASFGISSERIEFVGFQPRLHYLQTYQRIDICLDTLPYNGHTTSLDAYWMGVPVVTQVGHTVVGRAGWSQLNNLGLPELAAFDEQAFVDISVCLASDLPRLSQLRQTLRARLETSPLMDAKRFARAMESIYRQTVTEN
jgi:predicted O-linked N-acetylglucosamine transferase (SPINDLY family)